MGEGERDGVTLFENQHLFSVHPNENTVGQISTTVNSQKGLKVLKEGSPQPSTFTPAEPHHRYSIEGCGKELKDVEKNAAAA